MYRSLPQPKNPLLPLFLLPTAYFENSCIESGANWGLPCMDVTTGKEGMEFRIFPPRSHHPTTGKPMGHQGGFRDGASSDIQANTAQGLPGSKVSIAVLASHTPQRTLQVGWWHPPATLPTPVTASTAHVVSIQHGEASGPASAQLAAQPSAGQQEKRGLPELSAGRVAPLSGSEAARQKL